MPVVPAVAGGGPLSGSVPLPGACGGRRHSAALPARVRALAGGGGLGTSEASALAGHCVALAEHCLAQVPVVSGGGWWSSEAAPM